MPTLPGCTRFSPAPATAGRDLGDEADQEGDALMLQINRRSLAGLLVVAAAEAGLLIAPEAANAAAVAATVQVSGTLKVRAAPALAARIVGSVRNKQRITVQCVVVGTTVRGPVRTTNLWSRLSGGHYISNGYVRATRIIARCPSPSPQAVPIKTKPLVSSPYTLGVVRSADGKVNVRAAGSASGAVLGTLADGAKVNLACGVIGDRVSGTVRDTTQWDRTSNGRYISHAYLITPTLAMCAGGATPPPPTVTLTTAQFIAAAVPGAQLGWRQYGVPPSVTIAQAILESGWGRSKLASVDRNYFGIKCFGGVFGKLANGCHLYTTQECTKAGVCFTTTATFRTYSKMANSFRDHGSFLNVNSRYRPAFVYTRDANRFIWAVWKAGYATDPNYYTKVTGIMAANGLHKYDTWK
jgi:Mannosyl-glycoprotein endo-beta-N-acetylglucosaminidase